jgi:hypothetical protein
VDGYNATEVCVPEIQGVIRVDILSKLVMTNGSVRVQVGRQRVSPLLKLQIQLLYGLKDFSGGLTEDTSCCKPLCDTG